MNFPGLIILLEIKAAVNKDYKMKESRYAKKRRY